MLPEKQKEQWQELDIGSQKFQEIVFSSFYTDYITKLCEDAVQKF